MLKIQFRLGALALAAAVLLPADVTFVSTTKFEGGTLIDMVQKMSSMPLMGRMMGGNMKQAFDDQRSEVSVKGNKMARWGQLSSTIYDLDAGTVTTIQNEKHTYSTATYEEMQQRAEQMQQRMNRGQTGDLDFDVKAEMTGQTRVIEGETAKEVLITMTAKEANAQGQMMVKTHAWLAPMKPAMKEAAEFQRKLGAKYAFAYASMGPGMMQAGKGISAAMTELGKQDGYPVVMETEVSGVSPGGPMAAMGGNSDPNAPLIKMLIESSQFAQGAVDDSKFVVPAGYKQDKRGR